MLPTPIQVCEGNPGEWMVWMVIPDTDPVAYHLLFVEEEE